MLGLKKKGKGMIDMRTLMLVLVIPIMLMVMVTIFGYFEGAVDTSSLSSDAQSAINDTATQSYNAFNIASIIPLVVIAVLIITLLLGAFVFRG
jgi:hypothetical protein